MQACPGRVPSARRRSHGSACCPSTTTHRGRPHVSPYADKYAPRGLHPCTGLLHVLYVPESRGAGQLASAGHYCKVRTLRRTRTSLATGVCSAVLPHTTSYTCYPWHHTQVRPRSEVDPRALGLREAHSAPKVSHTAHRTPSCVWRIVHHPQRKMHNTPTILFGINFSSTTRT